MRKISVILAMFILSLGFSSVLHSCGLEDIANINPPTDLDIYNAHDGYNTDSGEYYDSVFDNVADGWIRFKADNREYERKNAQEYYLIVGYDIYYSFSSGSNFKLANVYDPHLTASGDGYYKANDTLYDMRTEKFPDGSDRFPSKYFNSIYDDFYTSTTFPIPLNFVQYLNDRDYNVRFCFFDDPFNDDGMKNPYINNGNVYLENVYPSCSDYEKNWHKNLLDDDVKFLGFYDYFYYYKMGIDPITTNGSIYVYKMWFYIIAKGFNSADDVDRIPNYMQSSKSSTKEIYFAVQERRSEESIVDK